MLSPVYGTSRYVLLILKICKYITKHAGARSFARVVRGKENVTFIQVRTSISIQLTPFYGKDSSSFRMNVERLRNIVTL